MSAIAPNKRRAIETPDKSFTYVGGQPVEHRDTGKGAPALLLTDPDATAPLEIEECADLLREWGIA